MSRGRRVIDLAVVSLQQVEHVVGVLFFVGQDAFQHDARGGVLVGEITDELPIVLDGDAFGDQIFPDHFDQAFRIGVLRGGSDGQTLGIHVGRSAQLVDALGHEPHVLLLFFGVLLEFVFDAVAGETNGANGIGCVPEHAHDFRCQHGLEDVDGLLRVTFVGGRDGAFFEVGAGPRAKGLDVG